VGAVSAAPFGSASILPITWMYIKMMGASGLKQATENAILTANYVASKLQPAYPVLYTGSQGCVAHECIIDVRGIKEQTGIDVEDIAKRLVDFGIHAPTMSFPVPGTLMIEPTESESLEELDRFISAMLQIRAEIAAVQNGDIEHGESPLRHAPHTAAMVSADAWQRSYSREAAAYPVSWLVHNKYWPPVARIDNVYGDRNLVCACPPMESYKDD
jgi:glycine dehydrogenase